MKTPRIRCLPGYYADGHVFLWGVFHSATSKRPNTISRDIRKLKRSASFRRKTCQK